MVISLMIFAVVSQLLSLFEFCQVHRNYNIVADALAKEAKKPFGASGLARRFA